MIKLIIECFKNSFIFQERSTHPVIRKFRTTVAAHKNYIIFQVFHHFRVISKLKKSGEADE